MRYFWDNVLCTWNLKLCFAYVLQVVNLEELPESLLE